MEKSLYNLEIDEGLEKVMPPLSELELELLTESLISEGCRDPLVVWNGKIIDGHNRYRICQENRIPFEYVEKEFDDLPDARLWIIRNQLARRNVPDYVRIELVLPLEAELKAEAKKRQIRKPKGFVPQTSAEQTKSKETREELAEMAGVSRDTIMKAKKITKEADEQTIDDLRNGNITINAAYNKIKKREVPEEAAQFESALKPKEGPIKPQPEHTWGDIVPGFGIAQIVSDMDREEYTTPPDYVRYIAPMPMGVPEEENMDFEKAESCVEDAKQYFVHRMAYILQMINADCINEESIAKLSESITQGYEQIMKMLKDELKGGKEHE